MIKANLVIDKLKTQGDSKNIEGMIKFGINSEKTLGVKVPVLRRIAKDIKNQLTRDASRITDNDLHQLAQELWDSGVHEARILASMVDDPEMVTEKQMDNWIKDFDSWDVCDQTCMNLFDKTLFAFVKAIEWTGRDREFEKRAGFAMMACLAWHDKKYPDKEFEKFFSFIIRNATDERNFVKKAVNWALRQIGKRNKNLCQKAIQVARKIDKTDSKSARWIAKDAIRELNNYEF